MVGVIAAIEVNVNVGLQARVFQHTPKDMRITATQSLHMVLTCGNLSDLDAAALLPPPVRLADNDFPRIGRP